MMPLDELNMLYMDYMLYIERAETAMQIRLSALLTGVYSQWFLPNLALIAFL